MGIVGRGAVLGIMTCIVNGRSEKVRVVVHELPAAFADWLHFSI